MSFFGYTNAPGNETNATTFFHVEETELGQFKGFRDTNITQMGKIGAKYDNNNRDTQVEFPMRNNLFDGVIDYFSKTN